MKNPICKQSEQEALGITPLAGVNLQNSMSSQTISAISRTVWGPHCSLTYIFFSTWIW